MMPRGLRMVAVHLNEGASMKGLFVCLAFVLSIFVMRSTPAAAQGGFERTIVVRIDTSHQQSPRVEILDERGDILITFPAAAAAFPLRLPIEGTVRWIEQNPTWYPTHNTREAMLAVGKWLPEMVLPGDAGNALGVGFIHITFETAWMKSSVLNLIGIHGTNDPKFIGKYVSRGCVRMHNEDWKRLAHLIKGFRTRVLFIPIDGNV